MAKNNNLTDFLQGVANAIREKKGTSALIDPQDFESEIASISGGGDQPTLYAPTITIASGVITIAGDTRNQYWTDGFKVYVNEVLVSTQVSIYFDLLSYILDNELEEGEYNVVVNAYGTNFQDGVSNTITYLYRRVDPRPNLQFTGTSSFSVRFYAKRFNGTMEYSTDNVTWNSWNGTTSVSCHPTDFTLYLRGTGNTKVSDSGGELRISGNVQVTGNLLALLDYQTVERGIQPPMNEGAFTSLFNNNYNSNVINGPAINFSEAVAAVCINMFANNTSVLYGSTITCGTVYDRAFSGMFAGCSNLISAGNITAISVLATKSADYEKGRNFERMYYNCTKLNNLPKINFTNFPRNSFFNAFYGCSKIKLSTTQDATYTTPYKIPYETTGTADATAFTDMFASTGGSFTGTPSVNTTYYTSNAVVE